jgi:signal transduction histidine kinase
VWQDAARVQIEIADNGCGLAPANGSPVDGPAPGFGLMGIEERARSLGGEVSIRSTPGCGTTIHVTLRPKEARHV